MDKFTHFRLFNDPPIGPNNAYHVIIEGSKGEYEVSVIRGSIGNGGTTTPFNNYKCETWRQATKLANMLVETFGLMGWEDVAHNPINR